MRHFLLLLLLPLMLCANSTITLEQLKMYDANRIRIDRDNITRRGLPLTVQGKQLFTKDDCAPLQKFSQEAWEQRLIGRKKNRVGAALTIGGFVGMETGICLIPISSETEGVPSPTPFVLGASLPVLVTGLVKLNRGYKASAIAYREYERALRKEFGIPHYFKVKGDEDAILTEMERYQNYLNYTVTITPNEMGRFYNLRIPYDMNGTSINLSSQSAFHFKKQMPSFTPKAARAIERSGRLHIAGKLSMSGGLSLASLGGLLVFGGLLSEIGGGGPSDEFYITTGIIMPIIGATSFSISIPLLIRSQRKFNRALKTYDKELRRHYRINN